jgi:hypothetical protein
MSDKPADTPPQGDVIFHLPKARKPRSARDEAMQDLELSISGHFREQNALLQANNRELSEKLQRLTNGVERLVAEMQGVRTGLKEEAFARVGPGDAPPDLPTVSGEAALFYTYTAKLIGEELGFRASEIGLLLSARGLKWAGNGDYQEIGRPVSKSMSKFWHKEVPGRLRRVLDEDKADKYGIKHKAVLAIFRKWRERKLLATMPTSEASH